MNFKKLASYLLLVWLPLANSEFRNKNRSDNWLENDKDLETRTLDLESKEKVAVENVEKEVEENPVEAESNLKNSPARSGRASGIFPTKPSANFNLLTAYLKSVAGNKVKSAHKLSGSVKKDLSALNSNSIEKNKSAGYRKRKRSRRQGKVRKRETVMTISMEEDPNSLDEYDEEDMERGDKGNSTEMGSYLGAPCELTCSEKLLHVFCDPRNRVCECEDKYPVQIGVGTGCEKPKQLGDQCFYAQTCSFFDPNAICRQINHNAICQCKQGFHAVALRKGVKRMFCSEDISVVSADLPTLLGVATGIAVLTGLICFVLRLFSGNRYPPTRHYANANIAPPLLLSSDNQWINGIPLTVHGRPPSRSSCQRSTMSLAQYSRSKGVWVPASRAGAARAAAILLIPCHLQASRHPDSDVINNSINDETDMQPNDVEQPSRMGSRRHSFSSVQSTTSSQKSYSTRRFEQENQQRGQRAAMKTAREEAARVATTPTPSPISTEGLILTSKNPEEDPLCSNTTTEPPAKSYPPALAITKVTLPVSPSSINPST